MGWNYRVHNASNTIASISKKIISLGDCYEINIYEEDEELDIIMLVIAIDATNENNGGGAN